VRSRLEKIWRACPVAVHGPRAAFARTYVQFADEISSHARPEHTSCIYFPAVSLAHPSVNFRPLSGTLSELVPPTRRSAIRKDTTISRLDYYSRTAHVVAAAVSLAAP
jgi:hypothetical protein